MATAMLTVFVVRHGVRHGTITALVAGLLFGAGLLLSLAWPTHRSCRVPRRRRPVESGPWRSRWEARSSSRPAYRYARSRDARIDGGPLDLPTRTDIDADLVVGAAVFGVGWGLRGICPGPSLLLLTSGQAGAVVFVLAMCADSDCLAAVVSAVAPGQSNYGGRRTPRGLRARLAQPSCANRRLRRGRRALEFPPCAGVVQW